MYFQKQGFTLAVSFS